MLMVLVVVLFLLLVGILLVAVVVAGCRVNDGSDHLIFLNG